jgi:hypothetical protein
MSIQLITSPITKQNVMLIKVVTGVVNWHIAEANYRVWRYNDKPKDWRG